MDFDALWLIVNHFPSWITVWNYLWTYLRVNRKNIAPKFVFFVLRRENANWRRNKPANFGQRKQMPTCYSCLVSMFSIVILPLELMSFMSQKVKKRKNTQIFNVVHLLAHAPNCPKLFNDLRNMFHIESLPSQTAFSVIHFCAQVLLKWTSKNTFFTCKKYCFSQTFYKGCDKRTQATYTFQQIFWMKRGRTSRRHSGSV